MATRYGAQTLTWLMERGWKAAPVPKEFICGDQGVIDPQTGERYTVYEAARLHKERTGDWPGFLTEEA